MKKFLNLTKRNCLVFLRDRGSVFFSLLAMMIVLMLMGVFLGDMNEKNVVYLLQEYGGVRDVKGDEVHARELVQYWTLAGILVVNAVTVTLTVVGTRVADAAEGRLASMYSAPVSRGIIACSYVASAVLVGMFLCLLTLGAALCYITATGGKLIGLMALGKIVLLMGLNVCIFAVIMYLLALFVKSSGAWSGLATVIGTLVGFLGAIYLPMGYLPEKVAAVLKYLPVLHGASLLRDTCCEQALADTFQGLPEKVAEEYREYMGIQIKMGENATDFPFQIGFLISCGIIAFILILIVQRKKEIGDR